MGLYSVLCLTSDSGNFCFCAVYVLRLGVSYSSVVAWAYVIMGECWWPLLWGGVMFAVVFCLATPALRFGYLQVSYSIIVDSVSLFEQSDRIFISVLKLNYFTEHCKWDPIAYFDIHVAYYM